MPLIILPSSYFTCCTCLGKDGKWGWAVCRRSRIPGPTSIGWCPNSSTCFPSSGMWKEDEEMHHRPDGWHWSFGLGGGWRTFHAGCLQHLEGQWRRGWHGDWFVNIQAKYWYVNWAWVRHGSEVELKINNTDMVHAGRLNATKVAINVALVLKMGWLIQKENQNYTLGPSLHWEHIERDINKPWLREIEQGIPNFQLKRNWADLPDARGVNAFWHVTQNQVLRLSISVHWRFFHLNQAIHVRQSDAYLARLLGHWRQQYCGRTNHRLVAWGAVQTTKARHRLLRIVTHPVPSAPQCVRGSDRKPNRRNQRSPGLVCRSHAHHPHLAFQTGPIKRTLGLPPSESWVWDATHLPVKQDAAYRASCCWQVERFCKTGWTKALMPWVATIRWCDRPLTALKRSPNRRWSVKPVRPWPRANVKCAICLVETWNPFPPALGGAGLKVDWCAPQWGGLPLPNYVHDRIKPSVWRTPRPAQTGSTQRSDVAPTRRATMQELDTSVDEVCAAERDGTPQEEEETNPSL